SRLTHNSMLLIVHLHYVYQPLHNNCSFLLTLLFLLRPRPPTSTLFPYTTLFRSIGTSACVTRSTGASRWSKASRWITSTTCAPIDRKSTRLNSSHVEISYAVFCLKKKKNTIDYKTQ